MQKHTLILGPSLRKNIAHAEKLIENLNKSEREFCSVIEPSISRDLFSKCNAATKAVIIYDLLAAAQLEDLYFFTRSIAIGMPYEQLNINPKLIIISTNISPSDIPTDASFTERFNVINMYKILSGS
jgi:hypothetical protein